MLPNHHQQIHYDHDHHFFYVYQKDLPLILEEIKYMKLELITAKTQQIQKQFLEQLKHQEVQKQWNQ